MTNPEQLCTAALWRHLSAPADSGVSSGYWLQRFAERYPRLAQEARSIAGELAVAAAPGGDVAVYEALFPLTERPYYLDRPVDEPGWALFWAGYYNLLREFPAPAIRKGVLAWEMSGGKRAFPTPSELYPHVNAAAEPIRRAVYRAGKLVDLPQAQPPAPPQTAEERAAVIAMMEETKARLARQTSAPAAPVVRPMSAPISPSVQADLARRAQDPIPRKT